MRFQTKLLTALLGVTIFTSQLFPLAADAVTTTTATTSTRTHTLANGSGMNENNDNAIGERRSLKSKMTKSSKKSPKKSPKSPKKDSKKSNNATKTKSSKKTPKSNKKKSSTKNGPTMPPTPPIPCPEKVESVIQSKYGTDLTGVLSSPQAKALSWLMDDITNDNCEREDKILQRYILIVFYYSTGGEGWYDTTRGPNMNNVPFGWLGSGDECAWYGLACDENQQLTELDLSWQNLAGTIPNEITDLVSLRVLDLQYSEDVRGTIPVGIRDMVNLERLYIGWLDLDGTIPDLSKLVNLKSISTSLNRSLTGPVAGNLDTLRNLENVALYRNGFTGNIPDFTMNKNLKWLELSENSFVGSLDPKLFQLPNLKSLELASNKLTGTIPENFGGSTTLSSIDLSDNFLTGTIPGITGNTLQNLEYMRLDKNKLSGPVPQSICGLNLDRYDLSIDCAPRGNAQNECPLSCCRYCTVGKGLP